VNELAPRFAVVLDALGVEPGHRVLELGPGHGVLATALLDRVGQDGAVHLVDRSEKMLNAAVARNRRATDDGRLAVTIGRLQQVDLGDACFDRVVAVRVRELWTDGDVALPRIRRWLVPGGRVAVGLDAPGGARPSTAVEALVAALTDHGFVAVVASTVTDASVVTATAP